MLKKVRDAEATVPAVTAQVLVLAIARLPGDDGAAGRAPSAARVSCAGKAVANEDVPGYDGFAYGYRFFCNEDVLRIQRDLQSRHRVLLARRGRIPGGKPDGGVLRVRRVLPRTGRRLPRFGQPAIPGGRAGRPRPEPLCAPLQGPGSLEALGDRDRAGGEADHPGPALLHAVRARGAHRSVQGAAGQAPLLSQMRPGACRPRSHPFYIPITAWSHAVTAARRASGPSRELRPKRLERSPDLSTVKLRLVSVAAALVLLGAVPAEPRPSRRSR